MAQAAKLITLCLKKRVFFLVWGKTLLIYTYTNIYTYIYKLCIHTYSLMYIMFCSFLYMKSCSYVVSYSI